MKHKKTDKRMWENKVKLSNEKQNAVLPVGTVIYCQGEHYELTEPTETTVEARAKENWYNQRKCGKDIPGTSNVSLHFYICCEDTDV